MRRWLSPPPPPVEAQDVHGKVIATATWNFGAGGPEPGEEAPKRYQDIVDNFFMVGATVAFTTTVIEDITNSRGEITGNRITVRCNPDLICRWNGGDVRVEGNFTEESKDHGLPDRVDYVDPADLDSDALDSKDRERVEREIARAPNPVGTVQANPKGRTVTDYADPLRHCGQYGISLPSGSSSLGHLRPSLNFTEEDIAHLREHYVEDDSDNPTECVLREPHAEASEGLPATRPLIETCPVGYMWRGSRCVQDSLANEYNHAPASRAPSITAPESSLPEYEPPTQQQVDRCDGDRFCLDRLHINALNAYDREMERYAARWARYDQELAELETSGAPFWQCIPYDEWEAIVLSTTFPGARCHLVEYPPDDA
ncbi:MAG: hypothetical protein OXH20_09775 [bacterium]|nr:hypothetical protein [bacterium]